MALPYIPNGPGWKMEKGPDSLAGLDYKILEVKVIANPQLMPKPEELGYSSPIKPTHFRGQ